MFSISAAEVARPHSLRPAKSRSVAETFAGPDGAVWSTKVSLAAAEGAKHLSRVQLAQDLKGFGKGKAKWTNAWEVAQAASYVKRWGEHLLDWSAAPAATIRTAVGRTFKKGG
jgi:hypothetical protein